MRVTVAAIGKLKDLERDLVARYTERFDAAGRRLALGPLKIIELPESRAPDAMQRKVDEASRLKASTATAGYRVALDEGGESSTSAAFARRIGVLRDDGVEHLAFLIGGPDGHHADLLADTQWKLSLGRLTLPHGLARLILAEQLYRAATILGGHPYHRA